MDGKMPPMSDTEEDEEDEEDDEDDEDDSGDEEPMLTDFRPGALDPEETLTRLRMLRRWGVMRNSKQTFQISRTGKPSLELRYVARVLSMNRFQFRRLLAADAYERGERDDQDGAYSDEEDDDDDGFAGYKPLTVEQVWDGDTIGTGETSAMTSPLFFPPFFLFLLLKRRVDDRVITIPLWDLRRTEKFE